MSKNKGSLVIAPIAPYDSSDQYATHDEQYGKGGYRSVQTILDRDSIPTERRSIGMLVRVLDNKVTYELQDDLLQWSVPFSIPEQEEEVEMYDSLLEFPVSGEEGIIYVAKNTGKIYYWDPTLGSYEESYQAVKRVNNKLPDSIGNINIFAPYDGMVNFPVSGNSMTLYIDRTEKMSYLWDEIESSYYPVGGNKANIDFIIEPESGVDLYPKTAPYILGSNNEDRLILIANSDYPLCIRPPFIGPLKRIKIETHGGNNFCHIANNASDGINTYSINGLSPLHSEFGWTGTSLTGEVAVFDLEDSIGQFIEFIPEASGINSSIVYDSFVMQNIPWALENVTNVHVDWSQYLTPEDTDAFLFQSELSSQNWIKLTWGSVKTYLSSSFASAETGENYLLASQPQAEDSAGETLLSWTAQRIWQAIIKWGSLATSVFQGQLKGYTEEEYIIPATSGTINISLSNGNVQRITPLGTTSIVLPAVPISGKNWSITIILIHDGVNTPSFSLNSGTLVWHGSIIPAPNTTVNKISIYTFTSDSTSNKAMGSLTFKE